MFLLLFFSLLCIALIETSIQAEVLDIGTNPIGSIVFQAGSAVAATAAEDGLQMRPTPVGGTTTIIPGINVGKPFSFGIANELETRYAVQGEVIYQKPHPHIRIAAILGPMYGAWYVPAESTIKESSDLRGKKIGTGYNAQTIIVPLTQGMLANGGLSYESDIVSKPASNMIQAANDFAQGKTDALYFAMGVGKIREVNEKITGGLRVLSLNISPASLDALRRFVPVAYPTLLTPKDKKLGVFQPTHVMTFDLLLLVNADESEDAVYQVVRAMHNHPEKMTAINPSMKFQPNHMMKAIIGVSYHLGAEKYYREQGLWTEK